MKKEWLAYMLLSLGMLAFFGGLSHGSDGNHVGWFASVGGLAIVVVAYRLFRSGNAERARTE